MPSKFTPTRTPVPITGSDTMSGDAFGRFRVSQPFTIFDSKLLHDDAPLLWDESLETGSGISSAHSVDTASVTLTSTLDTAGKFTRQTFMRFNYQPGKSQQIFMTFVLDNSGGGTGVHRRVGYFDDENGIFLYDNEGTVSVVRRSFATGSAVDTEVAQSSWNIDPMDGTGPSGITVDWSKSQILVIDFEWLGVGRVRMGLNIDGIMYPIHEFLNANTLDVVYMSTPNLPLRYQIETEATSAASSLECICSTVISEGGFSPLGGLHYDSTAGTHVDANVDGTIYAVVGIRLQAAKLDQTILMESVSLLETAGNNNVEWLLLMNPTVAGTFTYSNVTNTSVQTAKGATANTVTGGTAIAGGHFTSANRGGASGSDIGNAIRLGAAIDGTVDEIVLCVRPTGSSNIDVEGGIAWREMK